MDSKLELKMKKKKNFLDKILLFVEKGGNALPHPATLFGIFALLIILLSAVAYWLGWEAVNPATGKIVTPLNLLEEKQIHWILTEMVENFTSFAPLGIVLVAMLGIGIAERSGLIAAAIRLMVISTPQKFITFSVVLAGILSNMASDVGYILLIPLAGIIYNSLGRNPLVGMAAAFAGVSGGFSANLFLGTVDPLLAGLSTEAAHIQDPLYDVNPTANYFFMFVSTFVIATAGTIVTEKIIAPRLGEYKGDVLPEKIETLTKREKFGLRASTITAVIILAIAVILIIPENGFFRGPQYQLKSKSITNFEKEIDKKILYDLESIGNKKYKNIEKFKTAIVKYIGEDNFAKYGEQIIQKSKISDDGLLTSPLIKGVVSMLFLIAGLMGVIYGFITKKFKNDSDVMKGMADSMKTLGLYLVLVFFASQFVAFFKHSNLGEFIAIKGALAIQASGLGLIPLVILFILLAATLNMFMGSASAKWAILAPVFVPMFMLMGYSPELSQVVYRIGDSVTNLISPMMSFFALIIAFMQKYDKKAGIGTVIATMLPYSMVFLIVWTILIIAWILIGLPLGPGAPIYYEM